ncbi:hypothetical protein RI578_42420 (plasmid) [Streptomyces sp. BB1-1-1]|uniref:hypothetical protein n=1 Tax=Streptomyces sp. BB1-1-1 TaxID=3074430 RepID=UPI0028779379|nr:hypothetical protein [Streptomyces sp. BB1-1-1]WND32834.1 hypothetical protein RI578_00210 [Streptomyces sp. BB1-1-1]WND40098.1 hypothetical protein RI578_40195 [Streptomyces sp. BB1-1-1]WND40930.1 hypothetical protein RI578_42420 [Streptomyces sp. BB1-1-1]
MSRWRSAGLSSASWLVPGEDVQRGTRLRLGVFPEDRQAAHPGRAGRGGTIGEGRRSAGDR